MEWMHERSSLVGVINPQTLANTALLTGAIDMSKWSEVMFILALGDMAAETIDFRVDESDASGGTYTAITGKAITQLAAHASNNDNKQAIITVRSEELTASKQFIKGRAVTGGATGGPACMIALGRPRYGPGTDDDLSSIVQIVT